MIFDHLNHVKRYSIPQINKILNFISKNNCLTLPNEQIDIDGKNLFVRVMEYVPKPAFKNKFETHQIHMDLQYIVSGVELMRVAPREALISLGDYDEKKDCQFFKAHEAVSDFIVKANEFAVFYPGEAHCPSCLFKNSTILIKKLVFKIKIN